MIHVMAGARKPRSRAYCARDRQILQQTTVEHLGGARYRITYGEQSDVVWGKPSRWEVLNYVKGQFGIGG
jgi:hypothetical protein